jgi:DNA topoisomerase-1
MSRLHRLPLDPKRSAAAIGLAYIRDATPGFTRRRSGKGFVYLDCRGKRVTTLKHLNRIRALAIPPAWERVWICPEASGHLQAIGYDFRGRKQYRYHHAYREVRNQTKFDRIPRVVKALDAIRETARRHLALPGMPRDKVLAAVISILDETGIRIGNEASAEQNKTFGITTLNNRHVEIEGSTVRFRFTGKSGVRQEMEINDRRLARIVQQCHDLPGHHLFEYVDEDGDLRTVTSTDVNAYLREVSGESLSAKDLRTWAGTVECAVALRDLGKFSTVTEGKRNVVAAIKTAAQRLGNRAATCRAYYVHPAVTEAYLEGWLIEAMTSAREGRPGDHLSSDERAIVGVIERYQTPRELSMTA